MADEVKKKGRMVHIAAKALDNRKDLKVGKIRKECGAKAVHMRVQKDGTIQVWCHGGGHTDVIEKHAKAAVGRVKARGRRPRDPLE